MRCPFYRAKVWVEVGLWRKRNLSCVGPQREFPHRRLGRGITEREDGPIKVKTGKGVCSGASDRLSLRKRKVSGGSLAGCSE